ncbi:MAG: hypothetical protein HXX10_01290 [Rhodoplanes sp.]|uniref:hypothetical protein n=1 Tax=Rhodoplanes sp. TaxID=1968906 RepID=UPI0018075F5D|nr:hypothetical protein [Rhodoplanes sp.]NVO12648.1 hypothetical protein [Rhodoplanes sp.]
MRAIQVSTEVFAAIWKAQQEGEQSENAILARLLKVAPVAAPGSSGAAGFRDARYGIEFSEGFEIFRTYLGREHRAKATGGYWQLLKTGEKYPSLNELSRAIGTKTENAWANWFYIDANAHRAPISSLRDETKIIRRNRSKLTNITLDDLEL